MKTQELSGLANVNVELTSRCNKNCWMCGRRKVEREYPELALKYGDMDFSLVKSIAEQLPPNLVVQFHKDGDGLLYPRFGEAVSLFKNQIKSITTNGKLLVKKADEIIDNLDTISISVIERDNEGEEQYEIIKEFIKLKGNRKPYANLRFVGNIDSERMRKYEELGMLIVRRVLHSPMGSFKYKKKVTIPEIGICLDFLSHFVMNREGKVSVCVRFDPQELGVIGDLNKQPLEEIWNCEKRLEWLEYHKHGERKRIPLCSYCEFWGVPTGYEAK